MSSIHDMISALIAMLMSAAFLHFGATGDSPPAKPIPHPAPASAASASIIESDDKDVSAAAPRAPAHHLALRSHCHGSAGAMPTLDAVRATSPLRRG